MDVEIAFAPLLKLTALECVHPGRLCNWLSSHHSSTHGMERAPWAVRSRMTLLEAHSFRCSASALDLAARNTLHTGTHFPFCNSAHDVRASRVDGELALLHLA